MLSRLGTHMVMEGKRNEEDVPGGRCAGRILCREEDVPEGKCALGQCFGRTMSREDFVPGGQIPGRIVFREENVLEERVQVGKISIRKVFVRNYPVKKTFGRVLNSRKSGDNR